MFFISFKLCTWYYIAQRTYDFVVTNLFNCLIYADLLGFLKHVGFYSNLSVHLNYKSLLCTFETRNFEIFYSTHQWVDKQMSRFWVDEISSDKISPKHMSWFLDLLGFSKNYWYLAKNCLLPNLYLNDSSVDRRSKDAPFWHSSYQ